MSHFPLDLSDADLLELNERFGLDLGKDEWIERLTTTPSYEELVLAYYQWHVLDLAARIPDGAKVPAVIADLSAPYPPQLQGFLEEEARRRAADFMINTIRPLLEDGDALDKRLSLLTRPLPSGNEPDVLFMRRVIYLAGCWYHKVELMDANGVDTLRAYFRKAWPDFHEQPITTSLLQQWRLSDYVIGTVSVNSTLN